MFGWWFATKGLRWSVQGGGYMELYSLVVCLAAVVLIAVTASGRKYFGAGFTAIAILFNPFASVVLSRMTFLFLDAVCIAVFLVSLAQSWTEKQARTRQAALPLRVAHLQ
jgi:uncharacterized protein DUF6804